MLTTTRLASYLFLLVTLAIWLGAAFHESVASNPGWYREPVTYIRATVPPVGAINPWPLTTAALAVAVLSTAVLFAGYRGAARAGVYLVAGSLFVILLGTGVYFVPTLMQLADHAALSDAEIVRMSRLWIQLNAVRVAWLLLLLVYALLVLIKLVRTSSPSPQVRD